jgi:hypothetical protein
MISLVLRSLPRSVFRIGLALLTYGGEAFCSFSLDGGELDRAAAHGVALVEFHEDPVFGTGQADGPGYFGYGSFTVSVGDPVACFEHFVLLVLFVALAVI